MQEFWNKKFSSKDFLYGKEPSDFVKDNYHSYKKNSHIMSLGEGEGRNAIFLSKQGFKIDALDISDVGLAKLEKWAKSQDLDIKTFCMNFADFKPTKKYDGVLCIGLHVRENERFAFFDKIFHMLNNNGVLLCEVFDKSQISNGTAGPKDLDLLYDANQTKTLLEKIGFKATINKTTRTLPTTSPHQGSAISLQIQASKTKLSPTNKNY